jgi:ditrans,polycis-polyprenyl diphosphate synthase
MPYTSRDEIATAVSSVVRKSVAEHMQSHNGSISDDEISISPDDIDITEEDIEAELMTSAPGSPPLDILVRTSGVRRLSDYYLWQVCMIPFTVSKLLPF